MVFKAAFLGPEHRYSVSHSDEVLALDLKPQTLAPIATRMSLTPLKKAVSSRCRGLRDTRQRFFDFLPADAHAKPWWVIAPFLKILGVFSHREFDIYKAE